MPQVPTGLMAGFGMFAARQADLMEQRRREEDAYQRQRDFLAYQLAEQEAAKKRALQQGGSQYLWGQQQLELDKGRLANVREDEDIRIQPGGLVERKGQLGRTEKRKDYEYAFIDPETKYAQDLILQRALAAEAAKQAVWPTERKRAQESLADSRRYRGRGGRGSKGVDRGGINPNFPRSSIEDAMELEYNTLTDIYNYAGPQFKKIGFASPQEILADQELVKNLSPEDVQKISSGELSTVDRINIADNLTDRMAREYAANPAYSWREGGHEDIQRALMEERYKNLPMGHYTVPPPTEREAPKAVPETKQVMKYKAKVQAPPLSVVKGKK